MEPGSLWRQKRGSENNDPFIIKDDKVVTETNNAGGILGGITNGMPVVVRVAVKPTPSISREQKTVDMTRLENTEISIKGRHDVCIVPRAVIVVESMMAVTLCDFALRDRINREDNKMSLDDLRKKIDELDVQIVRLIAERMEVTRDIGKEKSGIGKPVQDKAREQKVLEKVKNIAQDANLPPDEIEKVYRQFFAISKGLQGITVAFQGEMGAYSEEASYQFFGSGSQAAAL